MIFETLYVKYEISENAQNLLFASGGACCQIKRGPCAYITNNDKSTVDAVKASLNSNILHITFEDATEAEIDVCVKNEYITFTLKSVSRTDFLSIAFVNIEITESSDMLCGCLMGMTLSTHMTEHPGDNRTLCARAYPHIGLFNTSTSPYPAKAAVIGAPIAKLRDIQKKVISEVPVGELPISKKGGPWANEVADKARGIYTVFNTTVTDKNIDDVIDSLKRFSINQITLHHYGHYTQGDFKFDKRIYPNGIEDFKRLIERFHSEGIQVGIQTYTFFLVHESSYVSPVPHKDLDTLREFTLENDIAECDEILVVAESTDGMSAKRGYLSVNSPYLWIDDELVEFKEAKDGKFILKKRGACGTVSAIHSKGAKVRQLKEYFMIPVAKVGSPLFYEIARNTARFYDECGADYMYLDAIDGAFILDGEDYSWYHGADFIREMFRHIKREPVFECCYNPAYTASWYVRSRYGAVDESMVAHRQYVDAHVNYNMQTAHRMGITPELGWIDLFTKHSPNGDIWQNEPFSNEDLEYICSKIFATGASLAFLRHFHELKSLPCSEEYCAILKKYAEYKKVSTPTEDTKKYLLTPECGAILENGELTEAKYPVNIFERKNDSCEITNPFDIQKPSFRIDTLYAASDYDNPSAVTLLELDENKPIQSSEYRFQTPVDSKGNTALGVWCYGDGSGATVCIALRNFAMNVQRNSQHFIKVNFTGWKYFAFHENQNGTMPADVWPRKELLYTTYNELQKFYHSYRVLIDYSAVEGVDITVKGSDKIRLKPIRFVPLTKPCWVNPTISNEISSVKIHTTLYPDDILTFDGTKFIVKDWQGYVKDTPSWEGELIIPKGKSKISMSHEGDCEYSRAKLTFTLKGKKLQ